MRWPIWQRRTESAERMAPGAELSAYLDGEVTPAERTRLEAELAASPELQAELHALQRAKSLVTALPEMEPRRSFALTPDMLSAAMPIRGPQPAPARPSRRQQAMLGFGRAMVAAGVIGLMVVGVSSLVSPSGDDDRAASSESIALNKDAAAGNAPMAAPAAATMSTFGTQSEQLTPASGSEALATEMATDAATEVGTEAGTEAGTPAPTPNDSAAVPTAVPTAMAPEMATADGGQTPEPPREADDGGGSPQGDVSGSAPAADAQLTSRLAVSGDDDSGPSLRQILAIICSIGIAAGCGAWAAAMVQRARMK